MPRDTSLPSGTKVPIYATKTKNTLLRVIPTMTFQNSHVRFYVSLIGSGEGRHTTHLLKCVLLLSTSQTDWKQSSDILSDISFDILSDISSDILLMEEILHRCGHIWQYGMTSTPAPPVQCCVLKHCALVQDFSHSTSLLLWQIFPTNVKWGARGSRLQVRLVVQDFFHQPSAKVLSSCFLA